MNQTQTRQSIDGGGWINLDTATHFKEDTYWNGNNRCSVNTRSQWSHESLYRSPRGTYVLNHWSSEQGSSETWTRIDLDAAVEWLVRNDYEPDSPAEAASAAASEV